MTNTNSRMPTKKLIALMLFGGFFVAHTAFSTADHAHDDADPRQSLQLLLNENRHAHNASVEHLDTRNSVQELRAMTATGQMPVAVIINCPDSGVPPELIFDKGFGEFFVVRVAGNIAGAHEIGAVEYAVKHFGTRLVMVLDQNHSSAVTTTGDTRLFGRKIEGNAEAVAEQLETHSPIIRNKVRQGSLRLVKAFYGLNDGKIIIINQL